MKKIKITIFGILVLFGFLFMGELSILNLDTFQEQYYEADFYSNNLSEETDSHEMIYDFTHAAEKNNVDFFAVEYSWNKSYLYETGIIGTEGAIEHLKEDGIKEGKNKSIFFENQNVTFSRIEDKNDISDINTWYFTGGEEKYDQICAFKSDLIDEYGGGFPKEKSAGYGTLLNAAAVWSIIFCIVLAFSLYEVAYMKKEIMIRVIMGESVLKIFLKNVIQDTISFIAVFVILSYILRFISNTAFKLHWVLFLFILFLVFNAVINTGILKLDYKKTLASGEGDNGLLAVNYVLKAVLTILAILAIALNCTMIGSSLKVYQQKDFFMTHNSYSYYKMSYGFDSISENNDPDERLYRDFYEKFQKNSLQYADLSDYYNMKYPFVVINKNSFDELCEKYDQISEIKQQVLNNNISLMIPSNIKNGSYDYNNAMEVNDGSFFSEAEYGKWHTITYDKGINVTGIHNYGTGYVTNSYADPIILVNNTDFSNKPDSTGYDFYYNYDIMYDIPENDWAEFADKNELGDTYVSITNVTDEYEYKLNQSRRNLVLSVVLAGFILFLEFSLIVLILKMEYQFNATELALRKVYGYSLYERNIRLIKGTVASGVIGVVVSLIFGRLSGINVEPFLLVVAGVSLILIELLCIFIKAGALEKRRLATILKGEKI